MAISLDNYVDVATRIEQFRAKFPDGRLRPVNPEQPYKVETIGGDTFIVYAAAAYRTPDDVLPGIGVAWEAYPGKTQFTRGSELQNAETSAWGRALVAALQADTRAAVASQEEVRNRQAERDTEWSNAPAAPTQAQVDAFDLATKEIAACDTREQLDKLWANILQRASAGVLHQSHGPELSGWRNDSARRILAELGDAA